MVTVGVHKMTFYAEDEDRYKVRHRNNYSSPDTFYDAWLLLKGKQRDAFDYDRFNNVYPTWLEMHSNFANDPDTVQRSTMPLPMDLMNI